jgi:hypothetical protein
MHSTRLGYFRNLIEFVFQQVTKECWEVAGGGVHCFLSIRATDERNRNFYIVKWQFCPLLAFMPITEQPSSVDPSPIETPSIISSVFSNVRNYCKALRSGAQTSPEAAQEYAKLEAEFERREREAVGQ